MCGRCVIFTFDEVLQVINEIELGQTFNFEPDWPARKVQAFPNSAAPLIVPAVRYSHRRRRASYRQPLSQGYGLGVRGILEARRRIQHSC